MAHIINLIQYEVEFHESAHQWDAAYEGRDLIIRIQQGERGPQLDHDISEFLP